MGKLRTGIQSRVINLGDTVTDTITGFTGIVVGRVEYLTGCIQFEVQPKGLKDGVPINPKWIDEVRLGIQEASAGGPHDNSPVRVTPPL